MAPGLIEQNGKEQTETVTKFPKGVVLGPDGKP